MEGGIKKDFRVFFSWQSDSPAETNAKLIRKSLRAAEKNLSKKNPGINIILDEATRETPGSPNIADKIFEKLDSTQVYIADISTVTLPNSPRPCANPNVLLELGYAIAQAGWDRTILLLNKACGKFPSDLPFDIVQNRVSVYDISADSGRDALAQKASELQKLLEYAIQLILDKNPKTPLELRGLAPEKIRHERDLESLKLLFSRINIEVIQMHINDLPRLIRDRSLWFWEGFKSVVTSSSFHVYDKILEENIFDLYTNWEKSYSFVSRYQDSGDDHIFANPGDAPFDREQQKDWDQIEDASQAMAVALRNLLDRVREAYVEVDVNKTGEDAWREYCQEMREARKLWDSVPESKIPV